LFYYSDPGLMEFLDKIGQNFFGVPPPEQPRGGLFGGLFDSFINVLNEDDDEDDDVRPRRALSGQNGRGQAAEGAQSKPQPKAGRMETEDLD